MCFNTSLILKLLICIWLCATAQNLRSNTSASKDSAIVDNTSANGTAAYNMSSMLMDGEGGCVESVEHCWPHWQTCKPCGCCAWGASCNMCEHGSSVSTNLCFWRGARICNAGSNSPEGDNDTTTQPPCSTERPGTCSVADYDVMWSMGPGTSSGTFPETNSKCGRKCFNLFTGMDTDCVAKCL